MKKKKIIITVVIILLIAIASVCFVVGGIIDSKTDNTAAVEHQYIHKTYKGVVTEYENNATAMEEAVEHDLSSAGELVVSEMIEKDEIFIVSPDVCTNSEEISVTNNGIEDLTIYLYNFGEVIRQMSLAAGDTKVIDGLSGAFPYKIGVSAEETMQVELVVTD